MLCSLPKVERDSKCHIWQCASQVAAPGLIQVKIVGIRQISEADFASLKKWGLESKALSEACICAAAEFNEQSLPVLLSLAKIVVTDTPIFVQT